MKLSLLLFFAAVLLSCGGNDTDIEAGSGEVTRSSLELVAVITADGLGDTRGFSVIRGVLMLEDGTVWVADGGAGPGAGTPFVRRYRLDGTFLGDVARAGDGPGEYRMPGGLTQLMDGRVVLRDALGAGRLSVYDASGTFEATWTGGALGANMRWMQGASSPLLTSRAGEIWVEALAPPARGRRMTLAAQFLIRTVARVSADGELLGVIDSPEVPQVERLGREVNGVWQDAYVAPVAMFSLMADGWFAVARTDVYAISFVEAFPGSTGGVEVRPDVRLADGPIAVSEEERAWLRDNFLASGIKPEDLPEMLGVKPHILDLRSSVEGRLLVVVNQPSVFREGRWVASYGLDVFDLDGTLLGRFQRPDGFWPRGMRGPLVWGVHFDADGVQTVRVYRVPGSERWPSW